MVLLGAAACAKLDYHEISEDNSNIMNLVVKGMLATDTDKTYDSIIDDEAKVVTVQVPYYLSDTEQIQGDLTRMRLRATLPQGAVFKPSLAGIHDLIEGFSSTLIYASGKSEEYLFKAAYVKSKKSDLISLRPSDPEASVTVSVSQPSEPGAKGVIHAIKTATNEEALSSMILTLSPWATAQGESFQEGVYDLASGKDIVIVAQNGVDKTVYEVSFELPKLVDYGVGTIEALWGLQAYTDGSSGMTEDHNTSMAVIGNYLILSNSADFTKMPVYNRMTGEYLGNDIVNTQGIDAGRQIMAITNDEAGHMLAVAYTSTIDEDTTNDTVRGWVWKNGVSNPPTSLMYASLAGSRYNKAPYGINNSTKVDLYRTVKVRGDLTRDAVIATASKMTPRPVFEFVKDGQIYGDVYVEWPSGAGVQVSMFNSTAVIPLNSDKSQLEYLWSSGNFRMNVVYSYAKNGFGFLAPKSHWWNPSGNDIQTAYNYQGVVWGIDQADLNGARLVAVQNGQYSQSKTASGELEFYHRLYVFDMGISPTNTGMRDGFLFDSREGNLIGDESKGGPRGTGFAVTGLTSPHSFVSGKTVYDCENQCGCVLCVKGSDGYSVQIYMLTAGNGMLCYNLTAYDM